MAVCTTPRTGLPRGKATEKPAASQFLADTGELALRISGPGQGGRLVRIRSAKCTVGSAAGCTLRLHARGVEGLQCWILRGSGGTVIRRLNGSASLNGAHFDEALLAIGDRLNIGQVEMVVEECSLSPEPESQSALAPANDNSGAMDLDAQLNWALEQIRRLEGESRQGFEMSITAAERADQLRDALAAANEQLEEVCNELTAAQETADRQTAELTVATAQQSELSEKLKTAQGTIERQASELATATAQQAELSEKLTAAQETINRQSDELAAASAQQAELSEKLTAAQETINRQSDELAAATAQQAELTAASAQQTELSQKLAAAQETIERQATELTAANTRQTELAEKLAGAHKTIDYRTNELAEERTKASVIQAAEQAKTETIARLEAELAATHSHRETLLFETQRSQDIAVTQCLSWETQQAALLQKQEDQTHELETLRAELAAKTAEFTALEQQQAECVRRESQAAETVRSFEEKQAALAAEAEQLTTVRQMLLEKERHLSEAANQLEQVQQTVLFDLERSSESQQRAAEAASQPAEIASRIAELDGLLERLVDQRASLISQEADISRRQSDFEQRCNELNQQAEQFQARSEELARREADLAAREAEAASRAAEIELRQPSRDQICETTCQEYSRFSGAAAAAGDESLADESLGDELRQTVMTPIKLIADEDQPSQLAAAPHRDEAVAEDSSESADVHSALGRLAQAGVWRQNDNQEQPSVAQPVPVPVRPRFEGPAPPAPLAPFRPAQPPAEGEEESIESYMERLMQRVRGDGGASSSVAAPSPAKPASPAFSPPPEENVGATMVAAIIPQAAPEGDATPAEVVPRRQAPESSTDLSAMRELANSAARSAIVTHARKRKSQNVTQKLVGACLTLSGSLALFYFSFANGSVPGFVGALAGCSIAAYWMFGATHGYLGLKREKRESAADEAEPTAESEAK